MLPLSPSPKRHSSPSSYHLSHFKRFQSPIIKLSSSPSLPLLLSMSSKELEENLSVLQIGNNEMAHGESGEKTFVQNEMPQGEAVQVSCFTEDLHDVTLHFQIVKFSKQIYAWIGCNTAKLGHLYAAATTRPSNIVSATSILGGTSDNTGSSMARRLVLRTGLNIVIACNIPKDSPMLEATAERKLIERLRSLGYIRP